jgi:hypothetical protein
LVATCCPQKNGVLTLLLSQVGMDEWKKGRSDSVIFKMRERGNGCSGCCKRICCGKARGFML